MTFIILELCEILRCPHYDNVRVSQLYFYKNTSYDDLKLRRYLDRKSV